MTGNQARLVEALNIMADLEEAGLSEYHRTVLRSSAAALAASSDEWQNLRQTVEYLTGVPSQPGTINDWRAPDTDAAILRCRERGDDATTQLIAQMRLAYRQRDNEAWKAATEAHTKGMLDAAEIAEAKFRMLPMSSGELLEERQWCGRSIATAIRQAAVGEQ